MLSSVLRTRRAIEANITIMRTFVRLRQMLLSNEGLGRKLAALEKKYDAHFKGRPSGTVETTIRGSTRLYSPRYAVRTNGSHPGRLPPHRDGR